MTIKDLVDFGHRELIAFDSARLDAELLLSYVLGRPVTYILAYDEAEVGWFQVWRFKRLIAKRKEGIPVAYLRGHREFYGLEFKVNRDVLVPRPDTEALVGAVIGYIQPDDLLLDVGTGSGCIPIAILKHVKNPEAVATDVSGAALRVAIANARQHGLERRIKFFQSDLLSGVPPEALEDRHLVVTANLPYVPKGFEVNVETKFEPQIALYGGEDGMDIYKRLLEQLLPLEPKAMFFECFDFQKAVLAENAPGYRLRHLKNLSGGAGVIILEREKREK
ncbi:MAG: peptide chain release factor N(5)-glutamine methyltransferase, partial [Patescibacteria group bacterium]